jgi:hypothetical protein
MLAQTQEIYKKALSLSPVERKETEQKESVE